MWSKSSDPHQNGLIQFEFTEEGLAVKWFGNFDTEGMTVRDGKGIIEWHELAWVAGQQPLSLKEEIEWIKEQAEAEGAKAGIEIALGVLRDWHDKVTREPISPFVRPLVERCCALLEKHQATSPAVSPASPSPQAEAR